MNFLFAAVLLLSTLEEIDSFGKINPCHKSPAGSWSKLRNGG